METKELRIGNYLYYFGKQIKVNSINADPAYYTIHGVGFNNYTSYCNRIDAYDPIPLTKEWLLIFGFKPLVTDFQQSGIIIHTRKRGFVLRKSVPIIQHVHQLQNLYFALTGEELTIKT